MSEKRTTNKERAEFDLSNSKWMEGEEFELAKKFIETYDKIGDAVVLPSYLPSHLMYFDKNAKVIAGEDNWKDKITTDDLDSYPFVIKTMKVGEITDEDISDEGIVKMVYDTLLEQYKERPMDVYHIYSIMRQPTLRYKLKFEDFDGYATSKDEAISYASSMGISEYDDHIEEIDVPYSILLLRFNRKKLW